MGKRRTVRVDKFRAQIAESIIGPDNLVRVEFGAGEDDHVDIFLPDLLGSEETKTFNAAIKDAQEAEDPERELALLILSHTPGDPAEAQLERWLASGADIAELALIWGAERRRVNDAMGNFRFRA